LLVGRRFGVDVRSAGSGNIGAANVARVVGWGAGFATLFGDALKGALPVWLARSLGLGGAVACAAGIAAVAGHLFPLFARFRGGKGVATTFGVVLVLAPEVALACAAVFAAVALATRIASAASLAAAAALPIALYVAGRPAIVVATGSLLALAVALRHRDNVRRLWRGREPRF
jgi:glycerol-3-phosphate acyltransferase PlsY